MGIAEKYSRAAVKSSNKIVKRLAKSHKLSVEEVEIILDAAFSEALDRMILANRVKQELEKEPVRLSMYVSRSARHVSITTTFAVAEKNSEGVTVRNELGDDLYVALSQVVGIEHRTISIGAKSVYHVSFLLAEVFVDNLPLAWSDIEPQIMDVYMDVFSVDDVVILPAQS